MLGTGWVLLLLGLVVLSTFRQHKGVNLLQDSLGAVLYCGGSLVRQWW